MNNRILFGIMTILFNSLGVPCFMAGNVKAGILRIVFSIITCGILGFVQGIMGIVMGIKILVTNNEEYAEKKGTMLLGIPSGKKN